MTDSVSPATRLARTCRHALLACLLATMAACGGDLLDPDQSRTSMGRWRGAPAGPSPMATASEQAGDSASGDAAPSSVPSGDAAPSSVPPVDAGTTAPALPPLASTLTATGISGALKLVWTASTDADSYRVQKQLDGGAWVDDGPAMASTTLAADRALPVAQWARARFRVQACNAAGCTASADVQVAASMAATLRYLKASNTGGGDGFGRYVALSADGNTLVVGANSEDSGETGTAGSGANNSAPDSGAVYVFTRTNGIWAQQAYLKASNTESGDTFGYRLALSADGNTIAVGAINEDSAETGTAGTGADNSATTSGAVYVFTRSNGTWTQQAYLKASNTGAGDAFGESVTLSADGNTLAVGAVYEDSAETGTAGTGADNSAPDSGAVYVFTRSNGTWTQQAYLKASNTGSGDSFGRSAALSPDGNTLAVGAPDEDSAGTGTAGTGADNSATTSGAVYVFTRSNGTWTQQAYLKASNTGAGDAFGASVTLSADGNTLAVGAVYEDSAETGTASTGADNSAPDSGAVYVFTRSNGTWTQQAYLKASNTGSGDRFGSSVALSADGNTLAVSAINEDSAETGTAGTGADNSATDSGAVYVFTRTSGTWAQQAYLKASNTGSLDWFGCHVALSADGSTIAVGAFREDSAETGTAGTGADDSATTSGAVYTF
ncbi:MAG: hypothetical protein RJA99_3978 [Pseudomonadota bacterium]